MTDDTQNVTDSEDRTTYDDVADQNATPPEAGSNEEEGGTEQKPLVGETVDISGEKTEHEQNVDPEVEKALEDYYAYKEEAGEPIGEGVDTDADADVPSFEPADSDSQSQTQSQAQDQDQDQEDVEDPNQSTQETESKTTQQTQDTSETSGTSDTSDESDSDESGSESESDSGSGIGDYDPDDPPASFSDVAVDIEDLDINLDDQDWELGNPLEPSVIEFKSMYFELREPEDDDQIENALQGFDSDSPLPQRKALTQLVVNRPPISDDRWDSGMTPTERFGLSNQVIAYLNQGNSTRG